MKQHLSKLTKLVKLQSLAVQSLQIFGILLYYVWKFLFKGGYFISKEVIDAEVESVLE